MNIIEAIHDPNLFLPFLGDPKDGNLDSWQPWLTAMRVLYGLPLQKRSADVSELIVTCTGRDPSKLPDKGFDTALFLTGRRSGKSRISSVVGAYEAVLAGRESRLSKGETGIVAICSPTKSQSRTVKNYLRAIFDTPLLAGEVVEGGERQEYFELKNGTRVEILAGDFRTVRGYTLLAAIVDEACYFGVDQELKLKSDTALIQALRPALATSGGKLVCISSPYAMKGWCYEQWHKQFRSDRDHNKNPILVWNSPSRTMNPTLSQHIVEEALAEDLQAAKAEYMGEFRDDVCGFCPRDVIEAAVIRGRLELMPRSDTQYHAFVDLSGGRSDDAALATGHANERVVIVDLVERHRPPFNPYEVCARMAETCRRYNVRLVTGDNYSAEFVARAFEVAGMRYRGPGRKAFHGYNPKPKSQLYLELLPRLCSGEIELLDNQTLIDQLAGLERRTRSGGRDSLDHGPNGHDDVANVVAGVADCAANRTRVLGVAF